ARSFRVRESPARLPIYARRTGAACAFLADTKDAQDRSRDTLHPARMTNQEIVLITGANKGIGFETARRLADIGMTVLVGARDRGRGDHAVTRLSERSPTVHLVVLDITDPASIAAA